MMKTLFNSLDNNFKTPIGPLRKGEVLKLRVKLPINLNPENVQFIIYEYCNPENLRTFPMTYEKTDNDSVYFFIEISDINVNIYLYYFSFISNGTCKFLKIKEDSWQAYISDSPVFRDWQLTVYEAVKTHPNMNNGIMYQIFPDRFYRSGSVTDLPTDRIYRKWGELPYYSDDMIGSDFFCGDLKGITEKLNYLKSLSVSVIYLNPIWESFSNHRYNTGSYENVDPVLGNTDSLKKFIKAAHSLGMIVIIDVVFNHTGSDSMYFNKNQRYPNKGAYQGTDSPYYNWYYFYGNRDSYASWWNFDTLPKLNQNNPDLIKYLFDIDNGIMDKWYSLGIDGLRLDVADEYENHILKSIHEASARNTDSIVIIGEVWDNASNKCNYGHRMEYFLGKELTSVMNYPVRNFLLAYIRYGTQHWSNLLHRTLLSIFIEDYPIEIANSLMNFISSHDTVRAITKLAGAEVDDHDKNWQYEHDTLSRSQYILGRSRLILSYISLYFFPGIPSIFYGDEIGLSGQKDPFCRKCFSWNHIDKKLLNFMKKLGKTRVQLSDFLGTSLFDVAEITDSYFVFSRYSGNRFVFVFINRSDSRISIDQKKCICDFISKKTNLKVYDNSLNYNVLLSVGNNLDFNSIDNLGSIVLDVNIL